MSKSYGQVAASVAADKRKNPNRYCGDSRCLWRISSGICPKHPNLVRPAIDVFDLMDSLQSSLAEKASPVDFRCAKCGETRTTFNPREETPCRHIEKDAGNPFGNHLIDTHVWIRVAGTAAANSAPSASGLSGRIPSPDLDDDELPY